MYKSQPYYVKSNNVHSQRRVSTMIYYLFPRASLQINAHCKPLLVSEPSTHGYSHSLKHYLTGLKKNVQKNARWDAICKKSHLYNELQTVSKLDMPFVCFEIIELYFLMHFSWENFTKINSIHLGNPYTLRVMKYLRKNNSSDTFQVFDDNYTLNRFMTLARSKVDIAFCDASQGKTEYENAVHLILQLSIVFCSQKKKGICLVKYEDSFSKLSLDVFALLSHFYEKTYFVKPSVCLPTSGEKYLVCKGFVYDNIGEKMYQTLFHLYKTVLECPADKYIDRILRSNIPLFLWGKLEEINSIFGQPRLEQMQQLLVMSENPEWEYECTDMTKCQEWCVKHKLENYVNS